MVRVEHTVTIQRAVEQVFAVIVDFASEPKWQPEVISCTPSPDGPIQVGTRLRQIRMFRGQRISGQSEVMVFEPNQLLKNQSAPGEPWPHVRTSYAIGPAADGTQLTFVIELQFRGMMRLIEPLVRRSLIPDVTTRFATLKRMMEAGELVA